MSESDLLAWNEANDYEDQGAEDYGDGVACALVHEHDAAACAAPTVDELGLDAARAELRDLVARIDGSFESAAEGGMSLHTALENTRDRLVRLLAVLGVDELAEPVLEEEDGCAACGAHWSWTPWASSADKSGRRHQHASECSAASAVAGEDWNS